MNSSAQSIRIQEMLARTREKLKLNALQAAVAQTDATVPVPVTVSLVNASLNESNESTISSLSSLSSDDSPDSPASLITQGVDKFTGAAITYNSKQLEFISRVSSGEDVVLIGAAGSGKTTSTRGGMQTLIASGRAGILDAEDHSKLVSGSPGILIVAFTRRAVANIKRAVSEDMKANCLTIHAALEYQPIYRDVLVESTGEYKSSMCFEATRNSFHPLPVSIRTVVIEEASMVSVELFKELKDALSSETQFIFLGDIQQLPPVFGSAILGYKMLELPVVELTEIYRQALESPIIRLAHRILSGVPIQAEEYLEWKVEDKLTIHPWKKKLSADNALATLAAFIRKAHDSGIYSAEEDMILIPFNKQCGTLELNKHIAQHLARKRGARTFEIINGFNKLYFSVGDKILYDKEDATIVGIKPNPKYSGATPQPDSLTLDYWGYDPGIGGGEKQHHLDDEKAAEDLEFFLEQSISRGESEDRVKQCSHIFVVRITDRDYETEVSAVGEVATILHAYALTIHKSQGSEYKKVFLFLHQSHNTMLSRELLYTACTRAKEELYIICEPESMRKGIESQRIKGNTLEEKAEWFKGKLELNGGY